MTEAHRELAIGLEKFKAELLDSMERNVTCTSLQGVMENNAERICRGVMDQVEKLMEESGIVCQKEGHLDPLNSDLS
jgi:hypothetical protein